MESSMYLSPFARIAGSSLEISRSAPKAPLMLTFSPCWSVSFFKASQSTRSLCSTGTSMMSKPISFTLCTRSKEWVSNGDTHKNVLTPNCIRCLIKGWNLDSLATFHGRFVCADSGASVVGSDCSIDCGVSSLHDGCYELLYQMRVRT